MTTHDDIRAICAKLPGSIESDGSQWGFGIEVKGKVKGYCWLWLERPEPKKARVPNPRVLSVRTPGLAAKALILESDSRLYFTEDHYNGYPAVMVRLDEIEPNEIEDLLIEGWRAIAPKSLQAEL